MGSGAVPVVVFLALLGRPHAEYCHPTAAASAGAIMPKFMGVGFFKFGSSGWSEVYGLQSTVLSTALTQLNSIMTKSLGLKHPDVTHIGARLSDLDIRGDSTLLPGQGPGSYPPGLGTGAMPPFVVMRVRAESSSLYRGIRYLHGLPQDCFPDGSFFVPTLSWNAASTAYREELITSASLISRNPTTGAYTLRSINGVAEDGIWSRKVGRPFDLHRGRRSRVLVA